MNREPDIVERLRDIAGEWADAEIREEAADEIERLKADNERLRAALQACSADWISAPGTVMGAAQGLSAEFRRRMEIAAAALEPKP